jgi:hypothetical protein
MISKEIYCGKKIENATHYDIYGIIASQNVSIKIRPPRIRRAVKSRSGLFDTRLNVTIPYIFLVNFSYKPVGRILNVDHMSGSTLFISSGSLAFFRDVLLMCEAGRQDVRKNVSTCDSSHGHTCLPRHTDIKTDRQTD